MVTKKKATKKATKKAPPTAPKKPSKIKAMAIELAELMSSKEAHDDALKDVNKRIKGYHDRESDRWVPGLCDRIAKALEEIDATSMRIPGVGTVFTKTDNKPSIENEEEFFDWLRANGRADIIKNNVHFQTLRGLINERLENFQPIPPGVKARETITAQLRRSK